MLIIIIWMIWKGIKHFVFKGLQVESLLFPPVNPFLFRSVTHWLSPPPFSFSQYLVPLLTFIISLLLRSLQLLHVNLPVRTLLLSFSKSLSPSHTSTCISHSSPVPLRLNSNSFSLPFRLSTYLFSFLTRHLSSF